MNSARAIKQNSSVDQLLETIATRKKNRTKNIFFTLISKLTQHKEIHNNNNNNNYEYRILTTFDRKKHCNRANNGR